MNKFIIILLVLNIVLGIVGIFIAINSIFAINKLLGYKDDVNENDKNINNI